MSSTNQNAKNYGKKLFSADDFGKQIRIGDELFFDKPTLKNIKIKLFWAGYEELDVCAFLLGDDSMIKIKEDLVYFKSQRRWMPEPSIGDLEFVPYKGRVSRSWKEEGFKHRINWMYATLPLSADDSVIGPWDDDGDDYCGETMLVCLDKVDVSLYSSIVFAAVVYRGAFSDVYDPVARIYNANEDELIAEYKLADKFPGKDAVCFGRMVYNEESMMWKFEPMADAYNGGIEFLATEIYG